MGDAKVTSIRRTSTSAYGGGAKTRAEESGMPVYELTLTNPDESTGFAVVADPETVNEVIAYAPLGSLADTVFNKGLALYFQELAALADAVSQQQQSMTRVGPGMPGTSTGDYWQPGWNNIFNVRISNNEFVRWLTPAEVAQHASIYSWYFVDPVDYAGITSAYVPTQWGQMNPYSNRVPYTIRGTQEKVDIGCFPTAAGQLMAYHRYPSTYNWNLLTASKSIPRTPTDLMGAIIPALETAAQKEVSRLLYDIALVADTHLDPNNPNNQTGATHISMIIPALNAMGYAANVTHMDSHPVSSSLMIKDEISTYHRPVLYAAWMGFFGAGHIWVIDAICTQERWEYLSFFRSDGMHGLNRYRTQGNLLHCNWGWDGGSSDGWFFNFTPNHTSQGLITFDYDKTLYTGIKPL